MKILLDTANIDQIREINDLGILDGVTTNPTLIAKEGRDFREVIAEIDAILGDDALLFGEVLSLDWAQMVEEGLQIAKLSPKLTVKIPMCKEGIRAVHELHQRGVRTNVTLIFTAAQALLAARAGASFVSPFVGRLDEIGTDGLQLVSDIVTVFRVQRVSTQVICASLKQPNHVIQVAKLGADIATIPYPALEMCFNHPLSSQGIDLFLQDWAGLQERLGR